MFGWRVAAMKAKFNFISDATLRSLWVFALFCLTVLLSFLQQFWKQFMDIIIVVIIIIIIIIIITNYNTCKRKM